ncbi:N-acetylmuramoyl-L-alanine amidase [Blastopirellula sp. JC732]|uniref:N-acetylmuramoyl-L-alanine amidase n=1 Tax=Blastopirellula sediminis TaxID=2894196 RepID=A0A9X1MQL0_9BACT|nr:N-acetylmuramoyl-L-alanine amidase [Blastopirellula sediminis]MCC9606911.1 N-acetylmuramoyl-L-alanine amidase [Blastopirellula sediminis]MCC9629794.1 N-acetylmuramoyl-L-alanine amidase [Blastopirellula sediminis]
MNRNFFCCALLIAAFPAFVWAEDSASPQALAQPDWVTFNPSPHQSERKGEAISAIIMHYTAGGAQASTVGWFRNPDAQVSSHYVVGRDGTVVQMVPLDKSAWHAGRSVLAGKSGVNAFSVGIEICNWGPLRKVDGKFVTYDGRKYQGPEPIQSADGRYWEPYTDAQYATLVKLSNYLIDQYAITHITGHSDIATPKGRKHDPGEGFDWEKIRAGLKEKNVKHIGPVTEAEPTSAS